LSPVLTFETDLVKGCEIALSVSPGQSPPITQRRLAGLGGHLTSG
jgi:hypothetical protein